MSIISLPVEIQSHILSFIPWHDHFLVSTVCTLWSSILQRHGLRLHRHYNHPIPPSWDLSENFYPVYDAPTPRVSPTLYTPTEAPNTHVLLEMGVFMLEVREDGRTTMCVRVPREYVNDSLSNSHGVIRQDEGTTDSRQYSEFWEASTVTAIDSVLIDITTSPLLKSDKLYFAIQESDSLEGIDTSSLQIPGLPNDTRTLSFRIWDWNRDNSQIQPFGTLPSGVAINDPAWCSKTWDWVRNSPEGLVEVVKEHLRTHVLCTPGVERCFVQVEGFNMYGDSPGDKLNITVAAFPRMDVEIVSG
ncbi:hypothetical protein TWF970_005755 [Orbilia oligospora]|uniref:F-box domain-containing protein n=1 Tax=Orbilia oligospora TaxID=2813651 RepID=A0A7C8RLS9_ORBOL|nr:hypothetical protein TWF970_005755 [Orbilia oligospora]